MNQLGFSRQTFAYFEQAQQNENDRAWFDSHKQEYEEHVVVPFTHLILQMRNDLLTSYGLRSLREKDREAVAETGGGSGRTNCPF